MRIVFLAAALSLGAYAASAAAQQPSLANDQDKTLYALGVALGSNIKDFSLTQQELATVEAGIQDAALGKDSRVDMQVYGPKVQSFAEERLSAAVNAEKKASADFLAKMEKEKGATKTPSGVIYIPIKAGTGPSPKPEDTVKVNYEGTLRDGTVFDSSIKRGEPVSFPLSGVIPCWTEGVQKMKVGGKSKLVCPAATAYGDQGQGPIPGGAVLVFEVELLAIEQAPPQPSRQPQP
ncbi:MAG TPA: FKBP-type peptidyl-prolyl cis-trans isomerase [Gammaproteobacteria bacterium]|nr:FKBP-type peptidyl-prolyl cis-trans isomerase [Gammaproteobacteria bacterium]